MTPSSSSTPPSKSSKSKSLQRQQQQQKQEKRKLILESFKTKFRVQSNSTKNGSPSSSPTPNSSPSSPSPSSISSPILSSNKNAKIDYMNQILSSTQASLVESPEPTRKTIRISPPPNNVNNHHDNHDNTCINNSNDTCTTTTTIRIRSPTSSPPSSPSRVKTTTTYNNAGNNNNINNNNSNDANIHDTNQYKTVLVKIPQSLKEYQKNKISATHHHNTALNFHHDCDDENNSNIHIQNNNHSFIHESNNLDATSTGIDENDNLEDYPTLAQNITTQQQQQQDISPSQQKQLELLKSLLPKTTKANSDNKNTIHTNHDQNNNQNNNIHCSNYDTDHLKIQSKRSSTPSSLDATISQALDALLQNDSISFQDNISLLHTLSSQKITKNYPETITEVTDEDGMRLDENNHNTIQDHNDNDDDSDTFYESVEIQTTPNNVPVCVDDFIDNDDIPLHSTSSDDNPYTISNDDHENIPSSPLSSPSNHSTYDPVFTATPAKSILKRSLSSSQSSPSYSVSSISSPSEKSVSFADKNGGSIVSVKVDIPVPPNQLFRKVSRDRNGSSSSGSSSTREPPKIGSAAVNINDINGDNDSNTTDKNDSDNGVEETSTIITTTNPIKMKRVLILLLDTTSRQYELTSIYYPSPLQNNGENMTQQQQQNQLIPPPTQLQTLIDLIPKSATYEPLQKQKYIGLCRPTGNGEEMINSLSVLDYDLQDDEILIGIPMGSKARECVKLSKMVLEDARLLRLVRRLKKSASSYGGKSKMRSSSTKSEEKELNQKSEIKDLTEVVDVVEGSSSESVTVCVVMVSIVIVLCILLLCSDHNMDFCVIYSPRSFNDLFI